MAYTLLTDLNKIAKEEDEYKTLYETVICDMFKCDLEDLETMANLWANAEEPKEPIDLIEQGERASVARAGEKEWLQQATADSQEDEPSTSLGIQSNRAPKVGNMVAIGDNSFGHIVGVEPVDQKVIIKDKRSGQERVFKFAELGGPKMVNGQMAWRLNQ